MPVLVERGKIGSDRRAKAKPRDDSKTKIVEHRAKNKKRAKEIVEQG